MKKVLLFIIASLLVLIIAVPLTVNFIISPWLKEKLISPIPDVCSLCELKIGDIWLSIFSPGDVALKDIYFHAGAKGATEVTAVIQAITLHVSVRELWEKRLRIRDLKVDTFDVTVVDGDKKMGTNKTKSESERIPIHVAPSQFINGTFQYVRNHEGTSATIHVRKINGSLSSINPKSDALIKGHAHAQYENSGKAELKIECNPFRSPLQANIELDVKDQNLEDLSIFFEPNAGVKLSGRIIEGVGIIVLNGDELKARDWIVYENLEAKVKKDKDRSGFVAFFENIGFDLAMQPQNKDLPELKQTKTIELKREPNESVVSFILRGLKEASFKIATRANR